jgi:hypothetical protein
VEPIATSWANVLHDWNDERSITILRNRHRAMRGGGRVLVVERMTFADPVQSISMLLSDTNILVLTGAWSEPVTGGF